MELSYIHAMKILDAFDDLLEVIPSEIVRQATHATDKGEEIAATAVVKNKVKVGLVLQRGLR